MQISRRAFFGIGCLSIAARQELAGCGDKLLHSRGGLRFQRAFAAARKASILLYLSEDRNGSSLREESFQATLEAVGHTVTVVNDPAALEQTLTSAKFDLVLTSINDATALSEPVGSASSKPLLIPAMYKPARSEAKQASQKYGFLLKLPGSPARNLSLIDKAMKSRIGKQRS